MRRTILTLTTCALAIAFPLTASAYLTPEQVLEIDQTRFYMPINSRQADELAKKQEEEARARHYQSSSSAPAEEHAAAPDEAAAEETSGDDGEDLQLSPSTIRLLQRLENRGKTLHSGAYYEDAVPLAPSGPEGVAAVLLMVGSVLWTIRRARKMEKGRF